MINADTLIERLHLKSQVAKWRVLAIVFAALAVIVMIEQLNPYSAIERNYVARITFDGFIGDDQKVYDLIDEVTDNTKVKAVVLWLDTPGGSAVGGEEIFLRLRKLSEKKPVVAVMRSVAASAGYMIALGADHIVAREGTITGSIGVLIESAEISELIEKIGIKPVVVKSSPLKGSPSLFEKMSPEAQKSIQSLIDDFYNRFVDMVAERRKLPREKVLILADGRVYSGRSALQSKLIDAIGGEDEAIKWLTDQKHITKDTPIKDVEIENDNSVFGQLNQSISRFFFEKSRVGLDGLAAIWHPNLH
jgi:protease IV